MPTGFSFLPNVRRCLAVVLVVLGGCVFGSVPAAGQAPLRLVTPNTTVEDISFRFVDHQTFDTDRLREQIAMEAPGFLHGVRNTLAFLPGLQRRSYPFDPVTLQKDVVRLRRFYQQNGFLAPSIDYPASQLDTTANRIHVIFTIREGPPLTIRENTFQTQAEGAPLDTQLPPALQSRWRDFRARTALTTGTRYTDFRRTQAEGEVRTWFRNQGFAFAEVESEARIDSTANTAALVFRVDPGPRGRFTEIVVEGNSSISANIVRRELPFRVGDRFEADAVKDGQQQLFDLNLFRVALADVPEQPRDSTVTVRYRVREGRLRSLSGQVGYGTQPGVTLEGSWQHRNFYGNARNLTVGLVADTGYPQNPPGFLPDFLAGSASQDPNRRFRGSVTLRQPYLLFDDLTGSIEPFFQERINPSIGANPERFLSLNERRFGVNSTLIYDFLPFRSVSLQHSLARVEQFRAGAATDTSGLGQDDLFDKSVFSLSATLGDVDDFINPTQGYIFRPSVQAGGIPFESGVDFVRTNAELSGYLPLSDKVELAGRLFGGALWPLDRSRANLTLPPSASPAEEQSNRTFQDRFSEFFFYAGGGSDVRGWASQLAGGKVLQESPIIRQNFVYRPVGARSKVGVNLEARLPFPGLGSDWRTAAFLDAAYLSDGLLSLIPPATGADGAIPAGPDGTAIATPPTDLLVGTGVGMRYSTPFGFLRLDVAYKLTPDALDLRRPGDVGEAVVEAGRPLSTVPTRPIRRFRLHFGIGRTF